MLLLELEVLLPEGVDSINHDLDQLHLGVTQTVLVGDVIGVAWKTIELNQLGRVMKFVRILLNFLFQFCNFQFYFVW